MRDNKQPHGTDNFSFIDHFYPKIFFKKRALLKKIDELYKFFILKIAGKLITNILTLNNSCKQGMNALKASFKLSYLTFLNQKHNLGR